MNVKRITPVLLVRKSSRSFRFGWTPSDSPGRSKYPMEAKSVS